ncbi:24046_t:CDS:1, partial [Racocetra persica]
QLEVTQYYLKQKYEKELIINMLGHVQHDDYNEYCLKFAFEN